jgi:undecaprenyl-diphosphatase
MDLIHALILGLIEGFSEYLPISSTGHLILTSRILGLETTEFLKSFEISIQLGAILAVMVLYWKRLWINTEILKKIFIAFIPTGVIGFIFYPVIKSFLLESVITVLIALFLGGAALILFEFWYREEKNVVRDLDALSLRQALFIGAAQGISIIPGVSRAAATIMGGLFLGLDRKTIVEFSFLLAVPTMLAATGFDLLQNFSLFSTENFGLFFAGFITSFVTAIFVVKLFLRFIQQHTFVLFGAYRILFAMAFWYIFWL